MRDYSYFLSLAAFYLQLCTYSSDVIYQIVNGTISKSDTFHFAIYSNNSMGVILQCIDTEGAQFGMKIIQHSNDGRSIILNFNKTYKPVSLKQFCGCNPCNRSKLEFNIVFEKTIINANCNHQKSEKITSDASTNAHYDKSSENKVYPIPKSIRNNGPKIYIMMGNIGPYVAEGSITNVPQKDQIVMCVVHFTYNNDPISFIGEDSKVRSSCPRKCNGNICNGGICTEIVYGDITCDCHSTVLNGLHCNNSLRSYAKEGNHSYEKANGMKDLYFKMTWKTLFPDSYCLVEIVHTSGHITISIKDSLIMMDSSVLSHHNIDGTNFISVNIANNYFTLKHSNRELRRPFIIDDLARINVGFTQGKNDCTSFNGAFDFHYDIRKLRTPLINTAIPPNHTTYDKPGVTTSRSMITPVMIVIPIIIGSLILPFFVLAIILYKKSAKKLKKHMQMLTTNNTFQRDLTIPTFTETGDYCLVQDNSDYEIIDNSNDHEREMV